MDKFFEFINDKIFPIFANISTVQIVELIALLVGFLLFFRLLEKNNATKISVFFIGYLLVVSIVSILMEVNLIIYLLFVIAFMSCVIVMFATEIKRSVWDSKHSKPNTFDMANVVKSNIKSVNNTINEIVKALQNMSKNDIGAIIVLSNTKIPNSILDSGVKLDCEISSALIESVFFPKTPLHDGAIIIQNDKIQAAGCFLPLSQETDLPKELGTRHRAGIGVTEILNVTSIIVSEETGIISYAHGGKITRYADSETLKKILKEYYWKDLLDNQNVKDKKKSRGDIL